ncbi:MAG TPA: hypothetical protein VNO25_03955 [Streptosporangiaceae bacterium]|jgi:hypothetical protein|nr:hypothetical protein [Streptosporangiaceae bacterium]
MTGTGEPEGRAFVDGWQAMNLLHIPWDERIASIFLLSPDTRNGILYEADGTCRRRAGRAG